MEDSVSNQPLSGLKDEIGKIVRLYEDKRYPDEILQQIINESSLLLETQKIKDALGKNPYLTEQSVFDPETGELCSYQSDLIKKVHVVKYKKIKSENMYNVDYVIDWISDDCTVTTQILYDRIFDLTSVDEGNTIIQYIVKAGFKNTELSSLIEFSFVRKGIKIPGLECDFEEDKEEEKKEEDENMLDNSIDDAELLNSSIDENDVFEETDLQSENSNCCSNKRLNHDAIKNKKCCMKDDDCCNNDCCNSDDECCCKDSCCKDSCCKDSCCKDSCCKDSCCKDSCCKDSCCKDSCCKDSCCKNSCCKDECCSNSDDDCCKDSCCEEDYHFEPHQKEAILNFSIDPDVLEDFQKNIHYGESKENLLIHILCLPIAEIYYDVGGKILDILDNGEDEDEDENENDNCDTSDNDNSTKEEENE